MSQAVSIQADPSSQPHVFVAEEASRFAPAEIRQAIAYWVAQDRLDLAEALVAAGLSMHPGSQDILAIAALLAEVQADWAQAQDCIERLVAVQGEEVTAETCYHLVRVMRCRSAYFNAYCQAQKALRQFPDHLGLQQAHAELAELLESVPVNIKVEAQAA